MTLSWFDLGLTLKILNLFLLRFIEQSRFENHAKNRETQMAILCNLYSLFVKSTRNELSSS